MGIFIALISSENEFYYLITHCRKKVFPYNGFQLAFYLPCCYAIYQRKGTFSFFHLNSSHRFTYFQYILIPLLSKSNHFIFSNSPLESFFLFMITLIIFLQAHFNIWHTNSSLDSARSLTLIVTHQILNLKHTNTPSSLSETFCVIKYMLKTSLVDAARYMFVPKTKKTHAVWLTTPEGQSV